MCLIQSNTKVDRQFNWDGDRIIHNTLVPSARPVVGVPKYTEYGIDIREFLVTEHNAAVANLINNDIRVFVENFRFGSWEYFVSRKVGSFDYRAFMISCFLSENVKYTNRGVGKPWLFPDETIKMKFGDCEDISFLLASLLISSGISSYNVRVSLGKVKMTAPNGKETMFDHAWVMYKNEAGTWKLMEPLLTKQNSKSSKKATKANAFSYEPCFLFNDTHMWVDSSSSYEQLHEYLDDRSSKRLNPTFAGEAHQTILHTAFDGLPNSFNWFKQYMYHQFLFGGTIPFVNIEIPLVDKSDFNWSDLAFSFFPYIKYDSLDHFDNGYLPESWQKVNDRLTIFRNNPAQLESFARAAHAIADFYAHSSYAHFAPQQTISGKQYIKPFNPATVITFPIHYNGGSNFDLTQNKFTVNGNLYAGSKSNVPAMWDGSLISGRYSQRKDSKGAIEGVSQTTTRRTGESAVNFNKRGSLPHHNEIAVDGDKNKDGTFVGNALYGNSTSYKNQLELRMNTSVVHIQQAFYNNYNGADKVQLAAWWATVPVI